MAFGKWRGVAVNDHGDAQQSVWVEVRRQAPGFPIAVPIYGDADGTTTLDNPFMASDGEIEFYAVGGTYRIHMYNGAGFEDTLENEPIGTAQAADVDGYATAGFTWAPESATVAPPSAGCVRFNNADISLATHVYLRKTTLGNSNVSTWLAALAVGDWLLLSTGVGVEVGWPVLSITVQTNHYDIEIDQTNYAGPAGPLSFGDSGFVTVAQQAAILDAALGDLSARWISASAAGPASLDIREDSDFGTNRVRITVPSSLAADYDFLLPAANVTVNAFAKALLEASSAAAQQAAIGVREKLTGNRTYYVSTAGSNSNDGLTAGAPFATLQKAWDVIVTLDLGGFTATIQHAAAQTATSGLGCSVPAVGGNVILDMGGSTFNRTSGSDVVVSCPTTLTVQNGTFRTTTAGTCLYAIGAGSKIVVGSSVTFGATADFHIRADAGGFIERNGSYTISGGCVYHMLAVNGGAIGVAGGTVTVSGTPAFPGAFAAAANCGIISIFSMTFSGSATGARYSATGNAVINTNGGGASFLPGNSAGSVATGGQYL